MIYCGTLISVLFHNIIHSGKVKNIIIFSFGLMESVYLASSN